MRGCIHDLCILPPAAGRQARAAHLELGCALWCVRLTSAALQRLTRARGLRCDVQPFSWGRMATALLRACLV